MLGRAGLPRPPLPPLLGRPNTSGYGAAPLTVRHGHAPAAHTYGASPWRTPKGTPPRHGRTPAAQSPNGTPPRRGYNPQTVTCAAALRRPQEDDPIEGDGPRGIRPR
ncbi:hypothetical protein Pth03_53200 [Planotetraspora thailandica]|uniref:Uncharacterized protein n=1 Tax=Planotetraspora thailandica TaxID=487172 RepID=A0A8J3XY88_9ACTN|nr:hypothetical protein Pth03_53200 [Planotetraspora thailandica]